MGKIEKHILIAERVPPGDNWMVFCDETKLPDMGLVVEGLVETLTVYMRATGFKGNYRLEPLNGKLFAIEEEKIPEPKPVVYDLYGEV